MIIDTPRFLKEETGSILVVTLLIVFAVTMIGAGLAMVSSMDLKISGNQRNHTRAMSIAEAGLSEAIHRASLRNPTVVSVGGWTGNISLADTRPYDPNYEARLYLTAPGSAPAGSGSIMTAGTLQDLSGDPAQYSAASGTADVLTIEHKWEDRNGDGNRDADEIVLYDISQVPPENFLRGFPVDIVTVTGRAGMARRSIQAEITKRPVIGRTLGAVYVNKAMNLNGNPGFCGFDHRLNTPVGTKPMGCFAFHVGDSHLPGVTTTGGEIGVGGSVDLTGSPAPADTSSSNPWYSLSEVIGISNFELQQILDGADFTSPASSMDGVTYLDGDFQINSNTSGSGLIYVTGDLEVNGNFDYEGIIYVEGDLKITGTFWQLGTMIVNGTADYQFGAGNAGVLFSSEAISFSLGQSMPALVLSWREL